MMTPQRYERLCRLFESASGLELDQRSALLDRECADDPTLRRDVEVLLTRDSDPSPFLDSPALGEGFGLADADTLDPGVAEYGPGHRIDKYVIRQTLGEGGAAVVYLAEQDEPVRRRVALKIIKPGMDSRQVIARFEAERQALAMMDHVCVAKVFDAGSTEAGRPYFVMEHVPGISITEHCDRHRLNIEDRLELFMQVCEGVQHAHQKGIIHRDLKPGNVLVLTRDGQAIPKVIDFGVAKALHQRLTERTIFTEQGQLIGTPAYMSPEQAEMSAQDIDTRSDIYALGVLLYELLTGALPFDPKTLREAGFGKIQRIIREEEPPKPSTRFSSNGDESTAHAQVCRADTRTLIRALRGDLDWIVMKCLEKDRTRRYETAHGLALDIRRHLDHEPVQAGPPSRAYRLRKFVRRNRAGVAAGLVAAISLIAAAGVSAGFALSEAEQRRAAATERDIAQAINEFLNNDLLAAVAPSAEAGRGKDVLMRDVLDEAAKRIEAASAVGGRFEDMALVEAAIRQTLADTYGALGEYSAAEPHLERALELRRQVLGEEHPDTLSSMGGLAIHYWDQGRYDEAEPLYLEALELSNRVLGEEHLDTLSLMCYLAIQYLRQGPYDEAESMQLEILKLQKRVYGEAHPKTLKSMQNLAKVYSAQDRSDDRESLIVKTLELHKEVLGEENPGTLWVMNILALLYTDQGRFDEAELVALQALEISKQALGEPHPDTLSTMGGLARIYSWQGRSKEAEQLYLDVLESYKHVLGEAHPHTLGVMSELARLYSWQGRLEEAELLYLEAIESRKRVLGEADPGTLGMGNLVSVYLLQGRYEQAESLAARTLETYRDVHGEEHPFTLWAQDTFGCVLLKAGRVDEAEALFSDLVVTVERVFDENDWLTQRVRAHHGMCLVELGRYEKAERLLLEAYPWLEPLPHPDTKDAIRYLVTLYEAWGMPEEAAEWRAKLPEEEETLATD